MFQIDVRATIDAKGKRTIIAFPKRYWITTTAATRMELLDEATRKVPFSTLQKGTKIVVLAVKSPGASSLTANRVLVEIPDFAPGAILLKNLEAMAALMRGAGEGPEEPTEPKPEAKPEAPADPAR